VISVRDAQPARPRRGRWTRAQRVGAILALFSFGGCGTLSVPEEKQLGHEAQRQVREQVQLVRDRVIVGYVRDLGARLVANAGPTPFDFRFYVVENEEINAFALPAGAIYVHTGVMLEAQNAAEVAGVLAHEIAHVTARHVANLYRRQRNTGYGATLFAIAVAILSGNPYIANAGQLGASVAATAYLSTFTRDAEREADALAVETLIRAGYDPRAMVTFFQTLQQETASVGMKPPQLLASHPATEERISTVQSLIAARHLPEGLRLTDGGKLEIIQKRIQLLVGTDPD
jgi:predicted Zn-dependent protease